LFPIVRTTPETGSDRNRIAPVNNPIEMGSHILNLSSKLVCCSAQPLLETTQKLVLFALGKRQIVVSQLTVFLFKFAFNFVPVAF
jgi:hypothetical protein